MNLLTVNQCASLIGFPGRTITGWIRRGHLKAIRAPSKKLQRYYVKRDDLIALATKMNLPEVVVKIKKGK